EFAPGVWGLQLIPEVGLDVGNVYRRVNAGGTLRFGFNLPDDFGPARLTDPGSATGQPVQGLSTYAFVKGIGRYVEWNTFIEGSNERNPSRSVSLEPWVGEIGGGFAVDWRRGNWTFSATYQQLYFSREFEEQTTDDGLGAIALRALYEF
ncbi:MAG: lipid A-modifier LpxR family protein, partial [Planctomycetota bacterium]